MAIIGLYDIDMWHRGQSAPNLELMQIYNYFYSRNNRVIMLKPNDNLTKFQKIYYFKEKPNIALPNSLELNLDKGVCKTIEITKNTVIQDKDEIVVFGNKQTIKDLFSYKIDEVYVEEEIVKSKENIISLIDNYGDDAMAEVVINNLPEILVEKRLFESEIKTKYNLNILTLKRDEMPITVTKDSIIKENDTIVIYGNYENIKKVFLN